MEAYGAGAFPMADARNDLKVSFFQPIQRGVFDLEHIHIPRRLARTISHKPYKISIDRNFPAVINSCATISRAEQDTTWINHSIESSFCELNKLGVAHSIEAYDTSDQLIGGLYGLHLGGIFFGESMFSKSKDASKICLIALFAMLKKQGFKWIDGQLPNRHLSQFGLKIMPNELFLSALPQHLANKRLFPTHVDWKAVDQFVQSTTHTS